MKTFKIQSPCYRGNGYQDKLYSIAFTDEKGNILKGFGNHISENHFSIKNVYESEGTPWSDVDRIISIEEVVVDEREFDEFLEQYNHYTQESMRVDELRATKFGQPYDYVYGPKDGKEEIRLQEYNEWNRNHKVEYVDFYGFLKLIK